MNLLDDINFKSTQIKDFQKAYKLLANKLIQKGKQNETQKLKSNLLITERSINDYIKQSKEANVEHEDIHKRLYEEKQKYFEKKNFVNTFREEE